MGRGIHKYHQSPCLYNNSQISQIFGYLNHVPGAVKGQTRSFSGGPRNQAQESQAREKKKRRKEKTGELRSVGRRSGLPSPLTELPTASLKLWMGSSEAAAMAQAFLLATAASRAQLFTAALSRELPWCGFSLQVGG